MTANSFSYESLYNRDGFNRSLNHFKTVNAILPEFSDFYNLADILNSMIADKEITQDQLNPVLYALLVDKYHYQCSSQNLMRTIDNFGFIQAEVSKWSAVDLVLTYHHPELGLVLINPKNLEHWTAANVLRRNELINIYCGTFDEEKDPALVKTGLSRMTDLLDKGTTTATEKLKKGEYDFFPYEEDDEDEDTSSTALEQKAAISGPKDDEDESTSSGTAVPSKQGRMTPMYSVPVTNELFHNGNVEAWKKVIQSYKSKYPDLDVYIYYDGERIHDIHALFKWGKVKHGSSILFAVAGENIKDIAKLQRYLRQGASPRFEDFLRYPVNVVLKLF